MYSRKRGKHGSKKPPIKIVPKWIKYDKKEIEDLILKLAKEKYTTAKIGTILRDEYGIPDIKVIMNKSISQIMRENKFYPEFPEDLTSLFRKAINLREHLVKNKADKTSKKGLEHLESKIRRLVKFYAKEKKIPKDFIYDPDKIKLLVQK